MYGSSSPRNMEYQLCSVETYASHQFWCTSGPTSMIILMVYPRTDFYTDIQLVEDRGVTPRPARDSSVLEQVSTAE